MITWVVAGYSYELGHYVICGNVKAKSERAALLAARKMFDSEAFGYHDFVVNEINEGN